MFQTIKAFLPSMLKKGSGHIVCINSVLGFLGLKGTVDYATTKFALTGRNTFMFIHKIWF